MTPNDAPAPLPLPSTLVVAAYALGAALLASAAPLLAYAGSLALFGAPHVLAELRYVDGRFGRRLRAGAGALMLAILALVVGLRALTILHRIHPADGYVAELGLVATLAFVVVPDLAATPARAAFAIALGGALAAGSALAPWTTVVTLAILHNATPVGFLTERLAGRPERRRVLATCAVLFLAIPALIAGGLPARALEALGAWRPDATFGTVGALVSHLRVFVPEAVTNASFAPHVFAACAFLQLLHYGIVIGVLPRLLATRGTEGDDPVMPWPAARVLGLGIAGVGLVAAVGFVRDFAGTRAAYGLLASVHAWIELPVLLLALAGRPREALA